jgi:hypothetical protein
VLIAALALILGMGARNAQASSSLLPTIHYSSSGFEDLSVLQSNGTNPKGKITSVIGDKSVDSLLMAEASNGNLLEAQIQSINITPNGQISGVAAIIVRDSNGQEIRTISAIALRGNARFFEIWRRQYNTNDETLALDGQLSRRLLHNMTLIGTGGGAVFILQARQSETVSSRFGDVVMDGNLTIVAGRDGVGRAKVVISGIQSGKAEYRIDPSTFSPFVSNILWRGNARLFTSITPGGFDAPVQLLTIWYNERVNRAGQYQFLYRTRNGRYSYLLIQSGRLLARNEVQGQQLVNGDFGIAGDGTVDPNGFVGQLRDTSFIAITPGGITIIQSQRREDLIM